MNIGWTKRPKNGNLWEESNWFFRLIFTAWDAEMRRCVGTTKNPKLLTVLFKTYGLRFSFGCVVMAIQEIAFCSQSLFLASLLEYFGSSGPVSSTAAIGYASGIVLSSFCRFCLFHHALLYLNTLGIEIRVAASSLVYNKSSLLYSILGELNVQGSIHVPDEDISYAPQEPWLFQASIRENILFGQPFHGDRYAEVLQVCALNQDIQMFPERDLTSTGERGALMSGGQKARLNLARAVYRDASIYILDDPLSAVDSHVSKQIFNECIKGFLRDKTVLLVTHQIAFLQEADHIVWLDDVSGTYYLRFSISVYNDVFPRYSVPGRILNRFSQELAVIDTNLADIVADLFVDYYSSISFSILGLALSFCFWVDFLIWIYIAVVVYSMSATLEDSPSVGLAITQVIGMNAYVQWLLKQTIDFESYLTAVERVMEYCAIQSETNLYFSPSSALELRPEWPEKGRIKFDGVSYRYSDESPWILKNLNFMIRPLEKIGIVGRTGAGKSSLIGAIFRLANVRGRIELDGVDTSEVPLQSLRSSISIIPQDPVLFDGTLRSNLDPYDEHSDAVLWDSLKEVELSGIIKNLPGQLDSHVSEGGTNFSVGQRQLLCLARAILRNNKVLLLDEATANVDNQTDSLLQQTIRKKFHDCTILTVAHRLNTVMDSDRIMVLSSGEIVEFDHPHTLLQNKDGQLYKMVEQCGKDSELTLLRIAEEVSTVISYVSNVQSWGLIWARWDFERRGSLF
ncbi:unnamed protein product [Nesidiocoris tenuis]|uniref:ABC transporter domain-containing protein n=1 Tax=Nesidiocoris tenuis TaxID=355587 RepID=A0A6H5G859_9HEMI|nr:unnamed protein product [Nesidiocoris tenuis]